MKKLNLMSDYDLMELDHNELVAIEGGGFWKDVAHAIGATARCIYEFGQAGGEYQQSLPSGLKK